MATSRPRRTFQPILEDVGHRVLDYAMRQYVFRDSARGVRGVNDQAIDAGTTPRSGPGLAPSLRRSRSDLGAAGFDGIERLGRAVYNTISGRAARERERRLREEREREREERERRRARRRDREDRHHPRQRDQDRARARDRDREWEERAGHIERMQRVAGDLHGVGGTLHELSQRRPGHPCEFYDAFAQRVPRMHHALGGAVSDLRGYVVVERRRQRDDPFSRQRRREPPSAGAAAPARAAPPPLGELPARRRRRRADPAGTLNSEYYGSGNPTYEHDPGWRKGETKRARFADEEKEGDDRPPGGVERTGSWERRRPD